MNIGHTNVVGQSLDLPKNDCLEVCCVLPLKHTKVENVVGKGVFTVICQKETLVLYTTNADESSWVEDIQQVLGFIFAGTEIYFFPFLFPLEINKSIGICPLQTNALITPLSIRALYP